MKQVPIRLSEKDYKFLKELATEEETTMAAIIRDLIKAHRKSLTSKNSEV